MQIEDTLNCVAGDTISTLLWVNATAVNLQTGGNSSWMTVDLLGAGVGPTGAIGPTGPSGMVTDSGWHWINAPGEPTSASALYDLAGVTWGAPRFRRDAAGCVFLDGLVGNVTAPVTLFTLPSGYRPAYELRFQISPGAYMRVLSTGDVICAGVGAGSYIMLNGVTFMAEDYQNINWTYPTLQNGWTNLGQGCASARYFVDSAGDLHLSGTITGGAAANSIFILPVTWDLDQIFAAPCAPGNGLSTARIDCHASGGINTNGYIGGGTNAWLSLDGIVISNIGGTWWGPNLANSWANYGAGWAPLGYSVNKNGVVSMRGLIKSGVVTAGTAVVAAGTIPSPFTPSYQEGFFQSANVGQARCDAATSGAINFMGFFSGGNNVYVAVQGRWFADATEGSGASQQGAIGPTGATGPAGASSPLSMSIQTLSAPTVAASPYTVTHNLGTTNLLVQLWDAVTSQQVQAQVVALNTNQIQVSVATNMPNNVNVVMMGATASPVPLFPADLATKAYVDSRTVNLPAPVISGSGIQTFTDVLGDVWVAANGVYNGAWKRARDAVYARIFRNAALTAAVTTFTVMPYDTVSDDLYGLSVLGAGGGIACPLSGLYLVNGRFSVSGSAVGQRSIIQLAKNGTAQLRGNDVTIYAAQSMGDVISGTLRCVAGDTVQIQYYSTAALNFEIGSAPPLSWMDATYLGTG
jgi:hypothetical protein